MAREPLPPPAGSARAGPQRPGRVRAAGRGGTGRGGCCGNSASLRAAWDSALNSVRWDIGSKSFPVTVERPWNRFSREFVAAPSLEVSKSEGAWSNLG